MGADRSAVSIASRRDIAPPTFLRNHNFSDPISCQQHSLRATALKDAGLLRMHNALHIEICIHEDVFKVPSTNFLTWASLPLLWGPNSRISPSPARQHHLF
jgi:hypothetical protein